MRKFVVVVLFLLTASVSAQEIGRLEQEIQQSILHKNAVVGVAISDGKDTVLVNGYRHFPMQSIFKLPIALYVLSEIDRGKWSLNQQINISKNELLPDTWSPIRDKFPNGTKMSLAELIQYTVALSDNNGCDILLKMAGGPGRVEKYLHSIGINEVSIKFNEEQMHKDWNAQFQNWMTPKAAGKMLRLFYDNKNHLLSLKSHRFIWAVLEETKTGADKIKGKLPKETIVSHKTGSSGTNADGITAAENDIGVILLPNKKPLFVSIFVTDSKEPPEKNKEIIADISKAAWNFFSNKDQ